MNNETSYFLFQIISFKKYFYVSLGNIFYCFCGRPPSCGGPGQLPSLPPLIPALKKYLRSSYFQFALMSIQPQRSVLFCSLAVLDPRAGHTMDVLSPFISVLCHSVWFFHRESCPRLDVVHPGCAWSSSPACTWHCSLRTQLKIFGKIQRTSATENRHIYAMHIIICIYICMTGSAFAEHRARS